MNTSEHQDVVARTSLGMAKALELAPPGDLAAMRRMHDQEGSPLFWRFAARYPEIGRNPGPWHTIARILALLTPTGQPGQRPPLHDSGRHLGTVLCDGGDRHWSGSRPMLSEQRLARLLASRHKAHRTALERAARMLANSRPPGPLVNVPDIAWAVLNPEGGHIARDYYARLDHVTTRNPADSDEELPHA